MTKSTGTGQNLVGNRYFPAGANFRQLVTGFINRMISNIIISGDAGEFLDGRQNKTSLKLLYILYLASFK
jgi:hypothetical protein